MFSLGVLILLSPVFLLIALAVVMDSPGGPLYAGVRIGKDGVPFRMWKFRSMVANADRAGGAITAARDQRVTRVGDFLRRTKLDELPQFFNVLVGDMTLIGPRAEAPGIVAKYTERQRETLRYKPGITGIGAIHYTAEQVQTIPEGVLAEEYYAEYLLPEKLELELAYESTRTLWRDLGIIQSTICLMLKRNH